MTKLDNSLTEVKGVGEELAKKFAVLGIRTVGQLIDHYPRRYDDYSRIQPINRLKPGTITLKAIIKQAKGHYVRRGMHITEAVASDDTGSVRLIWFNQPYRENSLKHNVEYYVSGEFGLSHQRLSILNPSIELVSDFPVNTARIVPIYRETKGLKSLQIRKTLKTLLPTIQKLPETLPNWLIEEQGLIARADAIRSIHFPENVEALERAKQRLGFEEVFSLSLASLLNKHELIKEHALKIPFNEKLAKDFVAHLPFKLTDAQRKVIWQIYLDLQKDQPMNRLIEGDVGSGKTVVATMAAVMVISQGYQVAFMAPTELLARQHAENIHKLLVPLGMADNLSLLIGSMKPAQKIAVWQRVKDGTIRFIIGTHALIQEKVDIHKLGLVIIDEQHRFGVEQRKVLQTKAGHAVHVLSTTATPIPRSLALTLYGELDISTIDTKPIGRKMIHTKICSPNSREQLYKKIDGELSDGRQVFVVCPTISESYLMPVKSAEQTYEELSKGPFKHRRVGVLHGKMKADQRDKVMKQFIDHELDILVATTVIEVGVDVPNASVMLIENAERFGLAQIHQLRGRVGRSDHQGYCYLMMSDSGQPGQRLKALEESDDGFRLAELDLKIRGPGAIYGSAQHGQLDLRIAKLTDVNLLIAARAAAQNFIDKNENLLQYEELNNRIQKLSTLTNLN